PAPPGETGPGVWSYVNVSKDYLVGGINSATDSVKTRYSALSSSTRLAVFNRHTGKLLWSATARFAFRHNAICMGNGHLFSIDRPSEDMTSRLKRHGEEA